jgi:hypothetical protein
MQDEKKVDIYKLSEQDCKKYGFKKKNLIKVIESNAKDSKSNKK